MRACETRRVGFPPTVARATQAVQLQTGKTILYESKCRQKINYTVFLHAAGWVVDRLFDTLWFLTHSVSHYTLYIPQIATIPHTSEMPMLILSKHKRKGKQMK